MVLQRWNSLTAMFFDQAEKHATKPFLHFKENNAWKSWSWGETADRIARLAASLKEIGVEPGDRVVLVSENRPDWFIADIAIMAAGAVSVPTYTTYTERDYMHILENSGAKAVIISTRALARNVLQAAHEIASVTDALVMEDPGLGQQINCAVHLYDDLINNVTPNLAGLTQEVAKVTRDDIACLIYTSGTGGLPKGVKLHHGSILHNAEGAAQVIKPIGLDNNAFLSFLPLSHAYEHTAGQFLPIAIGATIWYAENIEKLAANMEEAKPTIMVVVPRLFEMLRTRLMRQVKQDGGLKAKLFDRTIEIGTKKAKGEPLSFLDALINPLLTVLVRKKVQQKFGGRLKALVAGGAPLPPDVGFFFASLGLPLLQGYGQTESGPVIAVNPPGAPKMHTVGKVLDATEVKIADDGEIIVRGELVMKGYWEDDAATKRALVDGWLHTGDIGRFDKDGYLEITDRKKDIIVNDKGENIAPQRIEGLLSLEEEIGQAMIIGDKRPYLVGLIVPDAIWLAAWARQHNKTHKLEELVDDKDLHAALSKAVNNVNKRVSNLEKVRRFIIASEAFTIENKQMTPTLKVRRHAVREIYGDQMEALYGPAKKAS